MIENEKNPNAEQTPATTGSVNAETQKRPVQKKTQVGQKPAATSNYTTNFTVQAEAKQHIQQQDMNDQPDEVSDIIVKLQDATITEMKAFASPPEVVSTVIEAVCFVLGKPYKTWKDA